MKFEDTHSSPHKGPSLIDKIRDELDLAYEMWNDQQEYRDSGEYHRYAQGIALALGILRNTSEDEEWKLAEERFKSG